MQASLHAQFRLLFCRETLLTWGTKASQCALRHAKPNAPRAQTLVLWGWVPFGIFAGLPTVALGGTAFAFPFNCLRLSLCLRLCFCGCLCCRSSARALEMSNHLVKLNFGAVCVCVCASACVRARVGGWTATALHVPTRPLHAPTRPLHAPLKPPLHVPYTSPTRPLHDPYTFPIHAGPLHAGGGIDGPLYLEPFFF